MLKRCGLFLMLSLSFLACKPLTKLKEEKNFRLYVESEDATLKDAVKVLVKDYNQQMGFEVLTLVDSPELSTSTLRFQKGLVEDGRKLGVGQWTTLQSVKREGRLNEKNVTTIRYGMELAFDQDNFLNKSKKIYEPNSNEYKHLFHLFCHEVGHGMQMDHTKEFASVMHPTIPEKATRKIDYGQYFQSIRNFLEVPGPRRVSL